LPVLEGSFPFPLEEAGHPFVEQAVLAVEKDLDFVGAFPQLQTGQSNHSVGELRLAANPINAGEVDAVPPECELDSPGLVEALEVKDINDVAH
jgi:hypothetical protein